MNPYLKRRFMIAHPQRVTFHLPHSETMNCILLDKVIRAIGSRVRRSESNDFWQFAFLGRELVCVASDDRFLLFTEIADRHQISADQLIECLAANFDKTLDARYSLSENTICSTFSGPLGPMNSRSIISACTRVAELADSFGRSYSCGEREELQHASL